MLGELIDRGGEVCDRASEGVDRRGVDGNGDGDLDDLLEGRRRRRGRELTSQPGVLGAKP